MFRPNAKYQPINKSGKRKPDPIPCMIFGVCGVHKTMSTNIRPPKYEVGLIMQGYPLRFDLDGMNFNDAVKYALSVDRRMKQYRGDYSIASVREYVRPVMEAMKQLIESEKLELITV